MLSAKPVAGLIGNAEGRLNPADMIAKMVEVAPMPEGKFRNVFRPLLKIY